MTAAFKEHTAYWISQLTEGRVRWDADVLVSDTAISTVSPLGEQQCWVAPADVRETIAKCVKPGEYDSVFTDFYSNRL